MKKSIHNKLKMKREIKMTGLIIGGCIFLIIVGLLVLAFNISNNNSRLETVNNALEKKIKNDINYVFKNNILYQQMKDEIKIPIIDLR